MATLDAASFEIAKYNWEYGPQFPQPRPAHVVEAPQYQVPSWYYYYTPYCGFGVLQVMEPFMFGEAPQYGSTITNLYQTRFTNFQQLGSQAAAVPTAAPTSGAYTGIPSGCGPSGIAGSPY